MLFLNETRSIEIGLRLRVGLVVGKGLEFDAGLLLGVVFLYG